MSIESLSPAFDGLFECSSCINPITFLWGDCFQNDSGPVCRVARFDRPGRMVAMTETTEIALQQQQAATYEKQGFVAPIETLD